MTLQAFDRRCHIGPIHGAPFKASAKHSLERPGRSGWTPQAAAADNNSKHHDRSVMPGVPVHRYPHANHADHRLPIQLNRPADRQHWEQQPSVSPWTPHLLSQTSLSIVHPDLMIRCMPAQMPSLTQGLESEMHAPQASFPSRILSCRSNRDISLVHGTWCIGKLLSHPWHLSLHV